MAKRGCRLDPRDAVAPRHAKRGSGLGSGDGGGGGRGVVVLGSGGRDGGGGGGGVPLVGYGGGRGSGGDLREVIGNGAFGIWLGGGEGRRGG